MRQLIQDVLLHYNKIETRMEKMCKNLLMSELVFGLPVDDDKATN